MRQRLDYKKGDIVGSCIYIEERLAKVIGQSRTVKRFALFQCSCGNKFEAILLQVKNGNTKSCGCLRDEKIKQQGFRNITHGQRHHPLYKMWQGMLRRCNNPKDDAYCNYGAREIKVCDRWYNIHNFINDMYPTYKKGLDIDRIDNSGNYEPSNCRWVTRKENMNNMRRNRVIEYKGESKSISEWSDYLKIPYKTLIARLNRWDIEKSFTH